MNSYLIKILHYLVIFSTTVVAQHQNWGRRDGEAEKNYVG